MSSADGEHRRVRLRAHVRSLHRDDVMARTMADAIATTAPSRPTRNRSWWRSTARPARRGRRAAGHRTALARTSVSGAIVKRWVARGRVGRRARTGRSAAGSSSGALRRPPDAEARDGGVAPGLLRIAERAARPPGPRRCHRRPRHRRRRGPCRARRRPRWDRQVAERHGPAHDRDRRRRRPAAPPDSDGCGATSLRRSSGWIRPRRPARTDSSAAMAVARSSSARRDGAPGSHGQAGRLVAERVRLVVEADRRVPPRAAREDPDDCRSRRAPGTRRRAPRRRSAIVSVRSSSPSDRRLVVDARGALEGRDERHLGRLDDAAHPDLAGGQSTRSWTCRCRRSGSPSGSRPARAPATTGRRRCRRRQRPSSQGVSVPSMVPIVRAYEWRRPCATALC